MPQAPMPHRRPGPSDADYAKEAAVKHAFLVWVFLLCLLLLGLKILSITPKEESHAENRRLAQMPALRLDTLFDGRFAEDFEHYVADQFPGRERFLAVDRQRQQLFQGFPGLGSGGVALIQREASNRDQAMPSQPLATEAPGLIQSTKPETRRFEMAEQPDLAEGLAPEERVSNIIIAGGRGMEVFSYGELSLKRYADRLTAFYQELPEEHRMISMLVPTAIAFYGPKELRSGYHSQYDAIRKIYEALPEGVLKVDAFASLAAHREEYLYFRSDHHWNGRGAYYGYAALCESLGLEAEPLAEMAMSQPETTFLGSLYGYTNQSPLLAHAADVAEIFQPREQGSLQYYDGADFSNPRAGVLLNASFPQANHYLLFSGGDVPLAVMESSLKNDRRICVVKDSYGNALVPFLSNHYEKVYVIDPRYFTDDLILFLQQEKIQDLLIVNYSFAVANPSWLAGFDQIAGLE